MYGDQSSRFQDAINLAQRKLILLPKLRIVWIVREIANAIAESVKRLEGRRPKAVMDGVGRQAFKDRHAVAVIGREPDRVFLREDVGNHTHHAAVSQLGTSIGMVGLYSSLATRPPKIASFCKFLMCPLIASSISSN